MDGKNEKHVMDAGRPFPLIPFALDALRLVEDDTAAVRHNSRAKLQSDAGK